MLDTKKAFQILPYMAKVLKKVDFKVFLETVDYKDDVDSAGMSFLVFLMENADKCYDEVVSIVALLDDKTEDEIAEQDFFDTMETLGQVLQNEKLMAFFGQAMR
jgi:hypothetical protein